MAFHKPLVRVPLVNPRVKNDSVLWEFPASVSSTDGLGKDRRAVVRDDDGKTPALMCRQMGEGLAAEFVAIYWAVSR